MGAVNDIRDILRHLPHRYPFILIDRVLNLEPGRRIVTLKNVTINEPYFQGHFPDNPIMPGVLILEAMAQSAGVLAYETLPEDRRNVLIYFMAIEQAKFRRMVVPGDQLRFEVEILKFKRKAVKGAGKAYVEDRLVAEARMLAAIGENA
jgi:beta-hydroxyacyl-ACP dehydratase FabZ